MEFLNSRLPSITLNSIIESRSAYSLINYIKAYLINNKSHLLVPNWIKIVINGFSLDDLALEEYLDIGVWFAHEIHIFQVSCILYGQDK